MMIQFYNNYYLSKFRAPLDPLCLIMALLNVFSLIIELIFTQALSSDTDMSILSKQRIGIEGSSDEEYEVESEATEATTESKPIDVNISVNEVIDEG